MAEADAVADLPARLPGRTKAFQRSGATRMCSVASICATASPRRRTPLSCAGMTLVSLKTSRSPGSSRIGQVADVLVGERRRPA